MDNFLGTLVFLLPGVLAYFWLQAFGINPVQKHSPVEFSAVSALLWLPVSFITLTLYNYAYNLSLLPTFLSYVGTIDDLKKVSGSFVFLSIFLLISIISSYLLCIIWAKWGYQVHRWLINKVRKWRGLATLSSSPTVWDEAFLNNNAQVVEVGKIDKPESAIIGCIKKVSRPFETERSLLLDDIEFFSKLVVEHEIPVANVYIDTKSGTYIKVFDPEIIRESQSEGPV